MSLYLNLVFALLVVEIVIFLFLILPFPYSWRRAMFHRVSHSVLFAKLRYVFNILFIFVAILFADSINRIYKVEQESQHAAESHVHDVRTETNIHVKKFYSQRNMYLTGSTLFLALILNRTYVLILELLAVEEENEKIKNQTANQSKEHRRILDNEAQLKQEIETLTKKLEDEKSDKDFETLKKQANQQHEEYIRLSDEYAKLEMRLAEVTEDKKSV